MDYIYSFIISGHSSLVKTAEGHQKTAEVLQLLLSLIQCSLCTIPSATMLAVAKQGKQMSCPTFCFLDAIWTYLWYQDCSVFLQLVLIQNIILDGLFVFDIYFNVCVNNTNVCASTAVIQQSASMYNAFKSKGQTY